MRELTESPLYHMIITIDDNIHSGGVSLQQTKEERYTIVSCNFFCQNERFYLKEIDCIRKNIVAFRLLTYPPNEQIEILQKKKNKRSQALP